MENPEARRTAEGAEVFEELPRTGPRRLQGLFMNGLPSIAGALSGARSSGRPGGAAKTAAVLLAALLVASCGRNPPVPPELAGDFRTLRETNCFAVTYTGIGGERPEQIAAFERIVNHGNGARVFRRLFAEAGGEGKLYAMCGLYFTDRAGFLENAQAFRTSEAPVVSQAGCITSKSTVREEMAAVETGFSPLCISDCCRGWLERRVQTGHLKGPEGAEGDE